MKTVHCEITSILIGTVHHSLYITLLLESEAEPVFVKKLCYIQTKMYRLLRKMTIYGHFSI